MIVIMKSETTYKSIYLLTSGRPQPKYHGLQIISRIRIILSIGSRQTGNYSQNWATRDHYSNQKYVCVCNPGAFEVIHSSRISQSVLIGYLTKDQEVTDIWPISELLNPYINVFFLQTPSRAVWNWWWGICKHTIYHWNIDHLLVYWDTNN